MDRKELKRQYKETIQPMGVYQIMNTQNKKIFIGCTSNINGRLNRIKFQLQLGSYPDKDIQKDYTTQGKDTFTFDVLDFLEPKKDTPNYDYSEDLKTLEEMWLDKLQPYGDKGYNKPPK